MEAVFGAGAGAEGACCMVSDGLEQAARRDMDRMESRGFMIERGIGGKGLIVLGYTGYLKVGFANLCEAKVSGSLCVSGRFILRFRCSCFW